MFSRRELLLGAGSLAVSHGAPLVRYVIGPAPADSVRFTRAYFACPSKRYARRVLETGLFAHASAGPSPVVLEGRDANAITVFAAEPGADDPSEATVRTPLAIRFPRVLRPDSVDFLISTVDVAPTLLGLAGMPKPYEMHGRDLSGLLTNGRGERPESIYSEGQLGEPDEWRMIVRGLDKLVVRPSLEPLRLFNLGEDPREENDLLRQASSRLKVDELTALIRVWVKRTGDGVDPSGLRRR